jgi:hypothetical protein
MQPAHARQRFLSNEFTGGEKRDGGLFAIWGNDSKFYAACPKIENGVSRITLRKEVLLGLQVDEYSSHSCFFKKGGEVKGHASYLRHLSGLSRMRSSRDQFGRARDRLRFEVARTSIAPSRLCKTIHLRYKEFCERNAREIAELEAESPKAAAAALGISMYLESQAGGAHRAGFHCDWCQSLEIIA